MENLIEAWKFTDTDREKPDILKGETPEEFLNNKLSSSFNFGADNLTRSGMYRLYGWKFDFTPYLKRFVVKTNDSIYETYAVNKTQARKLAGARVIYILEISKKS